MKSLETLLRAFIELHPEDAARSFEALDRAECIRLFKTLPNRVAGPLLERISPHSAGELLAEIEAKNASDLLRSLSPRVASTILHQFSEMKRGEILAALNPDLAKTLGELAKYPSDTAGGMMEPKVTTISIDLTVQQAISAIRKSPKGTLHYLYVTQRDGKLAGVLNMRDLLLAAPRDPVAEIVRANIVSVSDTLQREEVISLMKEKGFVALPVIDFEGRLIGVVRHAEALLASQESAFIDLQKLVGAGADEKALSPVSKVVTSRLPWLCINLLTAFMAAAVIGAFEGIIVQVAALAVLLPVVAGQGGNTGSQSLAVVMRGLALREIIPGVRKRVITKELLGGIINGVAVAIVTGVAVLAWRMLAGDPLTAGIGLALVIGLAMIVNMAAAAISGAVIPLLLSAVGRDPAQSASIFLTTVTDIVGFSAFLGFATLFMPMIA
jgi:magnesium transporter